MLTLEDVAAICKPHNDKLIAEGKVEKLERQNKKLLEALRVARLHMHYSLGVGKDYPGPDNPYPIIDEALADYNWNAPR